MRYLIVNADDLGLTAGVTRGILEAHRDGIVTSASLMVLREASDAAAAQTRALRGLSVGLHLELDDPTDDPAAEVARQCDRFERLMGRPPTHLDSHHDRHLQSAWLPAVLASARCYGVPVRGRSSVARVTGFYGQWHGETHLDQIGPDQLIGLLTVSPAGRVAELACHPGHVDPELQSGYAGERETELATLCDPRVRAALEDLGVRLTNFGDLSNVTPRPSRTR